MSSGKNDAAPLISVRLAVAITSLLGVVILATRIWQWRQGLGQIAKAIIGSRLSYAAILGLFAILFTGLSFWIFLIILDWWMGVRAAKRENEDWISSLSVTTWVFRMALVLLIFLAFVLAISTLYAIGIIPW